MKNLIATTTILLASLTGANALGIATVVDKEEVVVRYFEDAETCVKEVTKFLEDNNNTYRYVTTNTDSESIGVGFIIPGEGVITCFENFNLGIKDTREASKDEFDF